MGIAFSKITADGRTVIPREIRERLRLRPGDCIVYSWSAKGVRIEKVEPLPAMDPFAVFTEWSSESDERAFCGL